MTLQDEDIPKPKSNAVRRVISLVGGPVYICLISAFFATVTASPFVIVLLVVAAAATIEMLIICELSKRLFQRSASDKRFGLATLLLLVTGVSVYLGVLSWLVRNLADEILDYSLITLIPFAAFAFLFMAYSTIALTYFADGLVWAGIWAVRRFRARRDRGDSR